MTTRESETLLGLAALIDDIGSRRLWALIEHLGSAEAAWEADTSLLDPLGWNARHIHRFVHRRTEVDLPALEASVHQSNIVVIPRSDERYPPLLAAIPDAPICLFVRGNVDALHRAALGVVGTRKGSDYGMAATRLLVPPLARGGLTITSGLAYGIDAVAHRACLEAGGTTIAVLGTGIDSTSIYPSSHGTLANEIVAASGAVVSEYVPGTKGLPLHFPARNRIIAGLTLGTLVIEAPASSGALITARLALDYGRDVFAVPGPITEPRASGSNKLLSAGATPVLSATDVFDALEMKVTLARPEVSAISYEGLEERILATLSNAKPTHVDTIAEHCATAAAPLAASLTTLELDGVVRDVGGGRYIRIR